MILSNIPEAGEKKKIKYDTPFSLRYRIAREVFDFCCRYKGLDDRLKDIPIVIPPFLSSKADGKLQRQKSPKSYLIPNPLNAWPLARQITAGTWTRSESGSALVLIHQCTDRAL